jgi:tetratricopeptide (TPR) repeat protein
LFGAFGAFPVFCYDAAGLATGECAVKGVFSFLAVLLGVLAAFGEEAVPEPATTAATATVPEGMPEGIRDLAGVYEDEEAFVRGLRAFDRRETKLAEAALEEVKALRMQNKPVEAAAAHASAQARVEQVRAAYEFALKRYPNNARLHNFYGECLYDAFGDHAAALREWHLAISLDSKLSAPYNNIGLHEFHFGNYESGLRNLDTALKLEPDNPDYLYNMVQVYLVHFPQIGRIREWDKKKVYREAMKMSRKAAERAPDDYDIVMDYAVNFFKAEDLGEQADWRAAAKAWQAARALAGSGDRLFYCWLNEARCWKYAKRKKEAEACLLEALKIHPESGPAQKLLEEVRGGEAAK